MNIIYVLIPIAIILVLIAIFVFFWAVKTDQFEDLERQGYSILFDDDIKDQSTTSSKLHSSVDHQEQPDNPTIQFESQSKTNKSG